MARPKQLTLRGRSATLHKLVFELRYEHGFAYLDKCGRTMNAIRREDPQWEVGDITPEGASLRHAGSGVVLNFSSYKYDTSLERPPDGDSLDADVDEFIDLTERVGSLVVEQIGVSAFTRIGFRVWYLFPAKTPEDAASWITALGAFSVDEAITSAFGSMKQSSATFILESQVRRYRIALTTAERAAAIDIGGETLPLPRQIPQGQKEALLERLRQKRRIRQMPQSVSMIDVDTYLESPVDPSPANFLRTAATEIRESLESAFGRQPQ